MLFHDTHVLEGGPTITHGIFNDSGGQRVWKIEWNGHLWTLTTL